MKTKILAAVLVLAALALLMTACNSQEGPVPLEEPQEQIPTAAELEAMMQEQQGESELVTVTRLTTLYYQDSAGYLVPVSCRVPAEEGVAKQTLMMMVAGGDNDVTAAQLGLSTVIPEGTTISVDVLADGIAKVDLGKNARNCPDAVSENNMVCAIVQALTEYPTIDQVQFTINGEQIAELPNGTAIGQPLKRDALNRESVDRDLTLGGAQQVMVYFESESAEAMVPITRTVFSNPDLETAILETLKGPRENADLSTNIPKGTGLISVRKANGVVTINLSKEFEEVLSNDDGGRAAVKALVLTCSQFPDVQEVKVQVEGKAFELDEAAMATSAIVNAQEEVVLMSVFEDE